MAKKKELTEEERLEKALVPESEWPYELPEGWKWVRLEDINSFTGKSIEPSKFPDEEFELYSVPSYDEDFPEILRGKEIGSSKKEVEKNDILLCKINPRINRVWIVTKYTEHRLIASSEWIHIRSKVLIPNYLMWYFRSGMFREFMLSNVSGVGGSLMRAQPKMVNKYVVPIAPIEKQLEIVKQIESLFSKLEEAKEKVESVLESSENRKSAILHKAFTGELTKKWREENGEILASSKRLIDPKDLLDKDQEPYKIPDSWSWSTLDQVADIIMGQSPAGKDTTEDSCFTPLIGGAADMGELYPAITRYTKSPKKVSKEGDLILSIRATLGRPIYSDGEYCLGRGVAAIRSANISKELFRFFFLAFEKYLYKNSTGSTFSQISGTILKKMPFPLMPFDEQRIIIESLESLLEREQLVAVHSEAMIRKIEQIKRLVLVQAFR